MKIRENNRNTNMRTRGKERLGAKKGGKVEKGRRDETET